MVRACPAFLIGFAAWLCVGCADDAPPTSVELPVRAETQPLPDLDELPRFDLSLSVDDAYAAIPHRRTQFDFDGATVPEADAEYLRRAFHLVEQGTRIRVEGYRDLYHAGHSAADPSAGMSDLIAAFETMSPPDHLAEYQRSIIAALEAQRAVFDDWTTSGKDFAQRDDIGRNPEVREASRHLKHAYRILMRQYAGESPRNKDAFFDYHCALDFI